MLHQGLQRLGGFRIHSLAIILTLTMMWVATIGLAVAKAQNKVKFAPGQKVDVLYKDQWCAGEIGIEEVPGSKYTVVFQLSKDTMSMMLFEHREIRERTAESPEPFPDTVYYLDDTSREWVYQGKPYVRGRVICRTGNTVLMVGELFREDRWVGNAIAKAHIDQLSEADKDYLRSLPERSVEEAGDPPGTNTATYPRMHFPQYQLETAAKKLGQVRPVQFAARAVSLKPSDWNFTAGPIETFLPVQGYYSHSYSRLRTEQDELKMAELQRQLMINPKAAAAMQRDRLAAGLGEREPEYHGKLKLADLAADGRSITMVMQGLPGPTFVQTRVLADSRGGGVFVNDEILAINNDSWSSIVHDMRRIQIASLKLGRQFLLSQEQIGSTRRLLAAFLSSTMAVIVTDRLIVVDLEKGRAYQSEPVPAGFDHLAVSPDQTHIALSGFDRVLVFNCRTGKSVGILEPKGLGLCQSTFSPDGTQLASLSMPNTKAIVFHLNDGSQRSELTIDSQTRQLAWPVNDYLLMGRSVYHIDTGTKVWEYAARELLHLRGSLFVTSEETGFRLVELPHPSLAVQLSEVPAGTAPKVNGSSVISIGGIVDSKRK